jgi:hypothetical protein
MITEIQVNRGLLISVINKFNLIFKKCPFAIKMDSRNSERNSTFMQTNKNKMLGRLF